MKIDFRKIWNNKKKRTILIASAVAVCLLVTLIFAVTNWQSSKGKDPYELFPWGIDKEKVLRQLDKLGINYDYRNDELYFDVENVQGSNKSGQAHLSFSGTGILKSIRVKVDLYHSNFNAMAVDLSLSARDPIEDALNRKYALLEQSEDGTTTWQNRTWIIELSSVHTYTYDSPYFPNKNVQMIESYAILDFSKRQ